MLIGAFVGLIVAMCPAQYDQINSVTIGFPEGSAQISEQGREHISQFLTPLVGDEMAEVHVRAYFPYGERNIGNADAPALSDIRAREVRNAAIDLGVSEDLVGTEVSAMNRDGAVERLHEVEIEARVKSDCHPLAGLARRKNPYR